LHAGALIPVSCRPQCYVVYEARNVQKARLADGQEHRKKHLKEPPTVLFWAPKWTHHHKN